MRRYVVTLAVAAILPLAAPATAATAKQKLETCKVGADHEHLTGGKRKAFMARCMASSDRPARRAKKPQAN